MRTTNVHLEEVTMAARKSILLAVGVALLALAAMLLAGLPLLVALLGTAMVLAFGTASGGFGLVARLAFRSPRPRRPAVSGRTVAPMRVPQVR